MPTYNELALFYTGYKGYCPRVSGALAHLIAGTHDLTGFEPQERAEFLWGLWKTYEALIQIGWIEHTSDWDWFVQIKTADGKIYGDYCKDGVLKEPVTYEDGEDVGPYCDTFRCNWTSDNFQFFCGEFGSEKYNHYYPNLVVEVVTDPENSSTSTIERIRVGEMTEITISQR